MNRITKLPSSELEIMLIIWEIDGKVSTSDIMNKVKGTKTVQLIQSYLKRLEDKEFIQVEKIGRLNYFIPLVSLDEYRGAETKNFMELFYDKSPTKLVASLIKNNNVSKEELEKIKKLLEEGE